MLPSSDLRSFSSRVRSDRLISVILILVFGLTIRTAAAQSPFDNFKNYGLVGVGRIPADTFDQFGNGHQDTLGGLFSAVDAVSAISLLDGQILFGQLLAQPDRGFGNGDFDYHPRTESFLYFMTLIDPDAQPAPGTTFPQNQIKLLNFASTIARDQNSDNFTGFDASDTGQTAFPAAIVPASLPGATPGLHRSLDAEGIRLAPNGTFYTSDEYGPYIYHFSRFGRLLDTIVPPAAFIPKVGSAFGSRVINFTAASDPDSGRRSNRGFEGLGITNHGSKLVAMLQSPLIQDGGAKKTAQNTRILIFDASSGTLLHEYVYSLTLNNAGGNTPVSELLVINEHQFLVLERDNLGAGSGNAGVPLYKEIVLADTTGATDIAGTGCDLELGAPGQLNLPQHASDLGATGITPVQRKDFISIIDQQELARFGLNVKADAESDQNSITEKWEGLALLPIRDPRSPNDYILLVGNDNDFKASTVYHNGVAIATNTQTVDTLILAYRVHLPGVTDECPAR
jgi:hypothetical protein